MVESQEHPLARNPSDGTISATPQLEPLLMTTKRVPMTFWQRSKSRVEKIPGFGIWCSFASNACFAINIVTTKAIVNDSNVLVVGSVQALIKLAFILPAIIGNQLPLFGVKEERVYLLCLSVTTAVFQVCRTYAHVFMSAGDSSAIIMAFPVVVTLVGPFILKETFRKVYVFNAVLSMVGIFLVVKPSFIFGDKDNPQDVTELAARNRVAGISLSVFCIFVMTAYCVVVRNLKKTSSCTSCAASFSVSFLCFFVPCVVQNNYSYPECGLYSIFLVFSSGIHVADILLYYTAYKYVEAGPLSVVGTIEIPMILVLEMAILGTVPSWLTCLGVCLILVGVFTTAVGKWEAGRNRIKLFFRSFSVAGRIVNL